MEKFCVLRENTHNVGNFQETSNENRKKVKYGIDLGDDLFILMQFEGTSKFM